MYVYDWHLTWPDAFAIVGGMFAVAWLFVSVIKAKSGK